MQPTHKYYEADAYRTEAAGRILAAEPDGNGGGKIALDGTPAEVFSQVQKVKALGLDVPPMAELAMRLRAGGLSLPDGILTVADMVKELKKALCPSK